MTQQSPLVNVIPEKIAGGFDFPEGAVCAPDGSVFLVNCHTDVVSKVLPSGEVTVYAHLPGKGNGAKLRADGRLVVCDYAANSVVEVGLDGAVSLITNSDIDGNPLSRGPNDVIIAGSGDLYFTAPQGSNQENPVGKVYHFASDTKRTTIVAEDLAFPNRLSLSDSEDVLYLAESARSRVWRFSVLAPGKLGQGELFVQLSGGHDPDGMDFDEHGNLYIAYFGSGSIVVVNSLGDIIAEMPAGGMKPTNLSFGGPNGDWLYVTEAETHSLYLLKVGNRGLRVPSRPRSVRA